MKNKAILLIFLFPITLAAQSPVTFIYDAGHLKIINQNAAVRYSSEQHHLSQLAHTKKSVDDISINLSSMLLLQSVIHKSLIQVDAALKSSRAVLYIYRVTDEIYDLSNQVFLQAKHEPWLLLFAEDIARALKDRSIKVALEISDFVLKEGNNILMDHAKRDFLLRKVTLELQLIRALIFSINRSMYWTRVNGFYRSLNPYAQFINTDRQKAQEIIRLSRLLK